MTLTDANIGQYATRVATRESTTVTLKPLAGGYCNDWSFVKVGYLFVNPGQQWPQVVKTYDKAVVGKSGLSATVAIELRACESQADDYTGTEPEVGSQLSGPGQDYEATHPFLGGAVPGSRETYWVDTTRCVVPPTEIDIPADMASTDACNPAGVTNNVAWKDSLPADSDHVTWVEDPTTHVRTATLVGDNVVWTDGTTDPKVYSLPADNGEECETPEPSAIAWANAKCPPVVYTRLDQRIANSDYIWVFPYKNEGDDAPMGPGVYLAGTSEHGSPLPAELGKTYTYQVPKGAGAVRVQVGTSEAYFWYDSYVKIDQECAPPSTTSSSTAPPSTTSSSTAPPSTSSSAVPPSTSASTVPPCTPGWWDKDGNGKVDKNECVSQPVSVSKKWTQAGNNCVNSYSRTVVETTPYVLNKGQWVLGAAKVAYGDWKLGDAMSREQKVASGCSLSSSNPTPSGGIHTGADASHDSGTSQIVIGILLFLLAVAVGWVAVATLRRPSPRH